MIVANSRAETLADLIQAGRWAAVEALLAQVAERDGIDVASRLDDQALAILDARVASPPGTP